MNDVVGLPIPFFIKWATFHDSLVLQFPIYFGEFCAIWHAGPDRYYKALLNMTDFELIHQDAPRPPLR